MFHAAKWLMWALTALVLVKLCIARRDGSRSGNSGGHGSHDSREPKIAIVGAGASGLYTAYNLFYEHGLSDITIFEKDETACASTVSYKYDLINDESLDIGTIFLPASSFKILDKNSSHFEIDFDMWSPLRELIDKYNLELNNVSGAYILDGNVFQVRSIFYAFIYAGYDITDTTFQIQLLTELIGMLTYLEPLYEMELFDIPDIYNLGLTIKGETIVEWGDRLNFPILTYLLTWAADSAGMGPSVNSSAAYVLKLTEKFRMPYFLILFNALGIKYDSPYIINYPFIKALLYYNGNDISNLPTYNTIKTGFQSLWDNMIDDIASNSNNKIQILYQTEVTSVSRYANNHNNNNKVKIKTNSDNNNDIYLFDYVFISCRRDCVLNILDSNSYPIQYHLYEQGTSETIDYYAALYYLKNENQWMSYDGIYPIYPYSSVIGTNEISEIYNCQPYYGFVIADGSYFVPFGLIGPNAMGNNTNQCMNNSYNIITDPVNGLAIKNISRDDVLLQETWDLGSQVLPNGELNSLYEQLYDVQGYNGLFMIGETIAGYAVPNQFEFVLKYCDDWVNTMAKTFDC